MKSESAMPLTVAVVGRLVCPSDKGRHYFYDSRTPCLAVMVLPNGRQAFYYVRASCAVG